MAKKTKENDSIIKLSSKRDEQFIPCGIDNLDELLGGGFYRGRITEISGKEGLGKTHLASLLMANISKIHKVLYVDTEFALNKNRVVELGADPANISYVADSSLEKVCELMLDNVGRYDVIILDSLASLTPLAVANSEIGERSIGLFSLLIKHWVLKLRPKLAESKTAFIALNQYRPAIGLYVIEETPGGKVWQHACDVKIKLTTTSTDKIVVEKVQTGHWVHALIKKNRLGKPNATTKIKIEY